MNYDFWNYLDKRLKKTVKNAYQYHWTLGEFYELLYNTGLRGREATEKERWISIDYIKKIIHFYPSKKSNIRIFKLSSLPHNYLKDIINNSIENNERKYRQATNNFDKLFGCNQILIREKKTTLHIFRHNFIKKLVREKKTEQEIKQIIGHNDIRKTQHYITEEQIIIN